MRLIKEYGQDITKEISISYTVKEFDEFVNALITSGINDEIFNKFMKISQLVNLTEIMNKNKIEYMKILKEINHNIE